MTKKELLKRYLNRYNKAKNRIKELEKLLVQLREDGAFPQSPGSSPTRIQSNSVGNGTAEFALRVVEIEEWINSQKRQLSTLLGEILDVLDYLPLESDERAVFELRYLGGKREVFICKARYISRSTYYTICGRGIKELLQYKRIDEILNNYENDLKSRTFLD